MTPGGKVRLATVWLSGCSGCHMSLLDIDERLLELAEKVDIVYSPIVDAKTFPEGVDVTLVEGAVGTSEDRERLQLIRQRTKLLIAMGDCAVTGNVPAMRNQTTAEAALKRAYLEQATHQPQIPRQAPLPSLEPVRPLHELVKVDLYVPGCPPPAAVLAYVLEELLAGRQPDVSGRTRFGA